MTNINLERAALWNSLCNLGSHTKLKLRLNQQEILNHLQYYKDKWVRQNAVKDPHNNRWALPITSASGSVTDTMHLSSFGYMKNQQGIEYNESDFSKPTELYHDISCIKNLVDIFYPDIGRIHFLRLDRGGFFPPHRDFKGVSPEYLRLISVFGNCSPENYAFILNGKLIYAEPEWLYFSNVQLDHCAFSFSNSVYYLILTVKLTDRTHDIIMNNTMNL